MSQETSTVNFSSHVQGAVFPNLLNLSMVSRFTFTHTWKKNDNHLRKEQARWDFVSSFKTILFLELVHEKLAAMLHLIFTLQCVLYRALCTCSFGHVNPSLEGFDLCEATSLRNTTQLTARSSPRMCGLILSASYLVIMLYLREKSPSQTVVMYFIIWLILLTD